MKHTLLLLTLLLTACRLPFTPKEPQSVEAPRDPITAVAVREFSADDYDGGSVLLFNNKMFLWKENRTAEEVSAAMRVGKEIERLDDRSFPINRQERLLDKAAAPLKKQSRDLGLQVTSQQKTIEKKQKEQKQNRDDFSAKTEQKRINVDLLSTELAKPENERDAAKVTTLQNLISQLDSDLTNLDTKLPAIESAITTAQSQVNSLSEKKRQIDQQYNPLLNELNQVREAQKKIQDEGQAQVEILSRAVDYFKDQPTKVSFKFLDANALEAEVRDLNLSILNGPDTGERLRSFSTRDQTIVEANYYPAGGRFEMKLLVYTLDSLDRLTEAKTKLQVLADSTSGTSASSGTSTVDLRQAERDVLRAQESLKPQWTLKVTVRRARYDLTDKDGRIFFNGEIERVDAEGNVRKGIAKLVDKLN